MAINKKLIHFNTKVNFNTQLQSGNILDTSIVFIKETKEIWTHGQLYPCPLSLEEITTLLSKKVDKVTDKSLVSDSEIEKLLGLPNNVELNNLITTAKAAGDNAQLDLNLHKQNTSNPHKVTKAQVGLGNVTNDAQVKRSEMGVANGVATLDADGKVPAAQLPSYVDDIVDVYATYSKSDTGVLSNIVLYSDAAKTKTVTGEAGKIYQNIAAGEPGYQFRWTGTVFSQTGASSLIIGEVAGTAFDGARGKTVETGLQTHKNDKDNPHEVTKAQVGLGKVDNTSDTEKPVSTAQAAAIAAAVEALDATVTSTDGTNVQVKVTETNGKITGVNITTDNTAKSSDLTAEVTRAKAAEAAIQTALDNHKADQDKKHIPAGGHERQILAWKADGEAQWDDLAFTGLEELLAYGVEWDVTVADPHLTRIGNMSLHRTLPIQSQLKGCIAQANKVIYWLDENDWRFKKDSTKVTVSEPIDATVGIGNEVTINECKDEFVVGMYLRTPSESDGYAIVKVKAIDRENNTTTFSALTTKPVPINPYEWEIGSRLDGYDGTVRVYCPNFYIKSQVIGNTRRVWLSTVKIDNTWTYQHEILIDAYRSTVLNTVPENMGYLSTLPVNSAISVVNTAAYCRGGGNRAANDKYLTGADDTTIDIFRTDLGKPRTDMSRSTMRTYSRNAGNEMLSYNQYKNIFYWLYVVEYANFNCQEAYNATLTEDGYHQGGMGPAVTTMSGNYWSRYNGYYPLTPCGYCNEFGNGTGVKTMLITPTASGAEPTLEVTFQVPRWRGFDNPFGDIQTNLDGIIIDADANNHPNNMNYVYTCQDPDKFGETLTDDWEKVGEEIHQNGYTKLFNLGDAAHIIPNVMGGNTTQYKCDYHWTGSKNTTLIVGGLAHHGTYAGLGAFCSYYGVSVSDTYVGFRSVSRFVSFQTVEQG